MFSAGKKSQAYQTVYPNGDLLPRLPGSGARVLVALIYEMIRRDVHKGVAALCLGGGNSVAMAVER